MYKKLPFILLLLAGWFTMKYILLGNVSFENSFKFGFLYHGTAMVALAIISTWNGIKNSRGNTDFIDGFKHIAQSVVSYGIGATVTVGVWHHVWMRRATKSRLFEVLKTISERFTSEENYLEEARKSGISPEISLSEWITNQHEAAELFYSPEVQVSLSLMVYLLTSIFMSLIASILWTKVWGAQQLQ